MMHPSVDESKCIGCGACFKVCPVKPKVMEMREVEGKGKKSVIIHPESCDFGGACVKVCLSQAFQLTGDW
jgi:formate hydrogenlyase subunit 6/NADH:ubiquinone oxidoreductase subunit I